MLMLDVHMLSALHAAAEGDAASGEVLLRGAFLPCGGEAR